MREKKLISLIFFYMLHSCSSKTNTDFFVDHKTNSIKASNEILMKKSVVSEFVLYQFNNTYPHAKKVLWDIKTDSYIVNFSQYNLPAKITYNDRGVITDECIGLNLNTMNPKINKHLTQYYPNNKVITMIRNLKNRQRTISILLDSQVELLYGLSGEFLREDKS